MADLQRLVDSDPFKGVPLTPDSRLYVTFLSNQARSRPNFAYESAEGDVKISGVSTGEVVGVVALSSRRETTELMSPLDKELKQFDTGITTGSWNTIAKILRS